MEGITIAEIVKMDDGLPISKMVTGKIGYIGKVKPPTDPKYDASQDIVIEDGTGSLYIAIAGHAPIKYPEDKGKTISFEGWYQEDKKMWRGLSKDSYQDAERGKVTKMKCTKTGKLTIGGVEIKKDEAKKEEPKKEEPKTSGSDAKKSEMIAKVETVFGVPDSNVTKFDRAEGIRDAITAFGSRRIDIDDIINFADAVIYYTCGNKDKAIEFLKKVEANIKIEDKK